jgi:hypothetical protein
MFCHLSRRSSKTLKRNHRIHLRTRREGKDHKTRAAPEMIYAPGLRPTTFASDPVKPLNPYSEWALSEVPLPVLVRRESVELLLLRAYSKTLP